MKRRGPTFSYQMLLLLCRMLSRPAVWLLAPWSASILDTAGKGYYISAAREQRRAQSTSLRGVGRLSPFMRAQREAQRKGRRRTARRIKGMRDHAEDNLYAHRVEDDSSFISPSNDRIVDENVSSRPGPPSETGTTSTSVIDNRQGSRPAVLESLRRKAATPSSSTTNEDHSFLLDPESREEIYVPAPSRASTTVAGSVAPEDAVPFGEPQGEEDFLEQADHSGEHASIPLPGDDLPRAQQTISAEDDFDTSASKSEITAPSARPADELQLDPAELAETRQDPRDQLLFPSFLQLANRFLFFREMNKEQLFRKTGDDGTASADGAASTGMSVGAIAGIAAGGAVLLIGLIVGLAIGCGGGNKKSEDGAASSEGTTAGAAAVVADSTEDVSGNETGTDAAAGGDGPISKKMFSGNMPRAEGESAESDDAEPLEESDVCQLLKNNGASEEFANQLAAKIADPNRANSTELKKPDAESDLMALINCGCNCKTIGEARRVLKLNHNIPGIAEEDQVVLMKELGMDAIVAGMLAKAICNPGNKPDQELPANLLEHLDAFGFMQGDNFGMAREALQELHQAAGAATDAVVSAMPSQMDTSGMRPSMVQRVKTQKTRKVRTRKPAQTAAADAQLASQMPAAPTQAETARMNELKSQVRKKKEIVKQEKKTGGGGGARKSQMISARDYDYGNMASTRGDMASTRKSVSPASTRSPAGRKSARGPIDSAEPNMDKDDKWEKARQNPEVEKIFKKLLRKGLTNEGAKKVCLQITDPSVRDVLPFDDAFLAHKDRSKLAELCGAQVGARLLVRDVREVCGGLPGDMKNTMASTRASMMPSQMPTSTRASMAATSARPSMAMAALSLEDTGTSDTRFQQHAMKLVTNKKDFDDAKDGKLDLVGPTQLDVAAVLVAQGFTEDYAVALAKQLNDAKTKDEDKIVKAGEDDLMLLQAFDMSNHAHVAVMRGFVAGRGWGGCRLLGEYEEKFGAGGDTSWVKRKDVEDLLAPFTAKFRKKLAGMLLDEKYQNRGKDPVALNDATKEDKQKFKDLFDPNDDHPDDKVPLKDFKNKVLDDLKDKKKMFTGQDMQNILDPKKPGNEERGPKYFDDTKPPKNDKAKDRMKKVLEEEFGFTPPYADKVADQLLDPNVPPKQDLPKPTDKKDKQAVQDNAKDTKDAGHARALVRKKWSDDIKKRDKDRKKKDKEARKSQTPGGPPGGRKSARPSARHGGPGDDRKSQRGGGGSPGDGGSTPRDRKSRMPGGGGPDDKKNRSKDNKGGATSGSDRDDDGDSGSRKRKDDGGRKSARPSARGGDGGRKSARGGDGGRKSARPSARGGGDDSHGGKKRRKSDDPFGSTSNIDDETDGGTKKKKKDKSGRPGDSGDDSFSSRNNDDSDGGSKKKKKKDKGGPYNSSGGGPGGSSKSGGGRHGDDDDESESGGNPTHSGKKFDGGSMGNYGPGQSIDNRSYNNQSGKAKDKSGGKNKPGSPGGPPPGPDWLVGKPPGGGGGGGGGDDNDSGNNFNDNNGDEDDGSGKKKRSYSYGKKNPFNNFFRQPGQAASEANRGKAPFHPGGKAGGGGPGYTANQHPGGRDDDPYGPGRRDVFDTYGIVHMQVGKTGGKKNKKGKYTGDTAEALDPFDPANLKRENLPQHLQDVPIGYVGDNQLFDFSTAEVTKALLNMGFAQKYATALARQLWDPRVVDKTKILPAKGVNTTVFERLGFGGAESVGELRGYVKAWLRAPNAISRLDPLAVAGESLEFGDFENCLLSFGFTPDFAKQAAKECVKFQNSLGVDGGWPYASSPSDVAVLRELDFTPETTKLHHLFPLIQTETAYQCAHREVETALRGAGFTADYAKKVAKQMMNPLAADGGWAPPEQYEVASEGTSWQEAFSKAKRKQEILTAGGGYLPNRGDYETATTGGLEAALARMKKHQTHVTADGYYDPVYAAAERGELIEGFLKARGNRAREANAGADPNDKIPIATDETDLRILERLGLTGGAEAAQMRGWLEKRCRIKTDKRRFVNDNIYTDTQCVYSLGEAESVMKRVGFTPTFAAKAAETLYYDGSINGDGATAADLRILEHLGPLGDAETAGKWDTFIRKEKLRNVGPNTGDMALLGVVGDIGLLEQAQFGEVEFAGMAERKMELVKKQRKQNVVADLQTLEKIAFGDPMVATKVQKFMTANKIGGGGRKETYKQDLKTLEQLVMNEPEMAEQVEGWMKVERIGQTGKKALAADLALLEQLVFENAEVAENFTGFVKANNLAMPRREKEKIKELRAHNIGAMGLNGEIESAELRGGLTRAQKLGTNRRDPEVTADLAFLEQIVFGQAEVADMVTQFVAKEKKKLQTETLVSLTFGEAEKVMLQQGFSPAFARGKARKMVLKHDEAVPQTPQDLQALADLDLTTMEGDDRDAQLLNLVIAEQAVGKQEKQADVATAAVTAVRRKVNRPNPGPCSCLPCCARPDIEEFVDDDIGMGVAPTEPAKEDEDEQELADLLTAGAASGPTETAEDLALPPETATSAGALTEDDKELFAEAAEAERNDIEEVLVNGGFARSDAKRIAQKATTDGHVNNLIAESDMTILKDMGFGGVETMGTLRNYVAARKVAAKAAPTTKPDDYEYTVQSALEDSGEIAFIRDAAQIETVLVDKGFTMGYAKKAAKAMVENPEEAPPSDDLTEQDKEAMENAGVNAEEGIAGLQSLVEDATDKQVLSSAMMSTYSLASVEVAADTCLDLGETEQALITSGFKPMVAKSLAKKVAQDDDAGAGTKKLTNEEKKELIRAGAGGLATKGAVRSYLIANHAQSMPKSMNSVGGKIMSLTSNADFQSNIGSKLQSMQKNGGIDSTMQLLSGTG
ncbi:unnamed protein product [Amoebophrya sp. A120]|nr:unnamed protein product [Amoebophrya sp. A120]|eukprot:GSA120T00021500001.1